VTIAEPEDVLQAGPDRAAPAVVLDDVVPVVCVTVSGEEILVEYRRQLQKLPPYRLREDLHPLRIEALKRCVDPLLQLEPLELLLLLK